MANAWRDRKVAREFLAALKQTMPEPDIKLSGAGVEDWIDWMESALNETDPMTSGVEWVLGSVASVQTWTYRD